MSTTMTKEDLEVGRKLADAIIALVTKHRPPAAVAGCAIALAAIAHLAECGSAAAREMFEKNYEQIGAALKEQQS